MNTTTLAYFAGSLAAAMGINLVGGIITAVVGRTGRRFASVYVVVLAVMLLGTALLQPPGQSGMDGRSAALHALGLLIDAVVVRQAFNLVSCWRRQAAERSAADPW